MNFTKTILNGLKTWAEGKFSEINSNLEKKQPIGDYVTAVEGKGLSTEDFTTEEKEKLANISEDGSVSWNDLTDKPFGEENTHVETPFIDVSNISGNFFGEHVTISNQMFFVHCEGDSFGTYDTYVYGNEDSEINVIDESKGINFSIGMAMYEEYYLSNKGSSEINALKVYLTEPSIKTIPEEYFPATVPVIQSAEPGQAIAVKSVDENGIPTEWKAVNMSAGTGGEEIDTLSQLINYQDSLVVKDYSITENDEDFYKVYNVPDNKPVMIYVDIIAYADSECKIEIMTNTSTDKYLGYKAFTYSLPANEMISVAMPYSPLEDAQSIEMAFRNLSGTKIRVNKVIVSNIFLNEGATDVVSMIEEKAGYATSIALGTLGIDYIIPQMYGAYGDGLHDDTYAFQQCINNSQGKIIYIPFGTYLLKSTLILDETQPHYIIRGAYSTKGWYDCNEYAPCIQCFTDFLSTAPDKGLQKFHLEISNIRVRFDNPEDANISKVFLNDISLHRSVIKNCEVLMADTIIKGAMTYHSIISNCNFIGIKKAMLLTDYEEISSLTASSDNVINKCYISGAPSKNPVMIKTDCFTRTVISDCYIDFFKSILQGKGERTDSNKMYLRYDTSTFANCVFDFCWRIVDASARYSSKLPVSFNSCTFLRMSPTSLSGYFTNPDSDMRDADGNWNKCGVVVNEYSNNPLFMSYISLNHNMFDTVDYPIYLGENLSSCKEIYEFNSSFVDCLKPVTVDVYTTPEIIKTLHFDSLMNKEYTEIPLVQKFDNGYYRCQCFEGMTIYVNGELMKFHNMEWHKIVTVPADTEINNPDYVISEAESVIDKVIAAQSPNTFVLAAITDIHYGNGNYTNGVKHACEALKYIDERIKLDAVAVLGDITDGNPSSNYNDAMSDFKTANTLLSGLRFAPNLRVHGNHDYYENHMPEIFRHIGAYNGNVEWGNSSDSYFYYDFNRNKLRVIGLNTIIDNVGNAGFSDEQAQWFANTLDLSSKNMAQDWSILVLSHHPVDFSNPNGDYKVTEIIDAYINGTAYTKGNVNYDFTGKNAATFIGNIHGHLHNLLVDRIYKGGIYIGTQMNALRIATPESCYGKSNTYSGVWQQSETFSKHRNSAEDTSFVIYCINFDTNTIKAICYGAGYDRTITYGDSLSWSEMPGDENTNTGNYTNQIPIAIDEAGNVVTNGVMYADKRYNSSGSLTDAPGYNITGLIPVTVNDLIRVRWNNETEKYGDMGYQGFRAFNAAREPIAIRQSFQYMTDASNSIGALFTAADGFQYNRENGIIDFRLIESQNVPAETAYIAFILSGDISEAIITVNEAIE